EFDATTLQQLYAARSYEPVWVANAGMQPQCEALLATLEPFELTGALAPAAPRDGTSTAGLAELELLLSSALIRTAVAPEDLLAPGPRQQVIEAAAAGGDDAQVLY